MYKIKHNTDNEKVTTLNSDKEFIEFMQKILIENEDYDFSILGISDAKEYLEDYCSNLTLLNDDLIFFDEELNWLVDCEYYYRLYLKYGKPTIINEITVVNRTHGGGLTDTTPQSLKDKELKTLIERYGKIK